MPCMEKNLNVDSADGDGRDQTYLTVSKCTTLVWLPFSWAFWVEKAVPPE